MRISSIPDDSNPESQGYTKQSLKEDTQMWKNDMKTPPSY